MEVTALCVPPPSSSSWNEGVLLCPVAHQSCLQTPTITNANLISLTSNGQADLQEELEATEGGAN